MVMTTVGEPVSTSEGQGVKTEPEQVRGSAPIAKAERPSYEIVTFGSDRPLPLFTIRRYAELAQDLAAVEQMEDGRFFVEASELQGVWGDGESEEEARRQYVDAVFEWALAKIDQRHGNIPIIGSINLNLI